MNHPLWPEVVKKAEFDVKQYLQDLWCQWHGVSDPDDCPEIPTVFLQGVRVGVQATLLAVDKDYPLEAFIEQINQLR